MADRQPAVADEFLHRFRQFQQPQRIGHDRAALADFRGDVLLRELELLRQLRIAVRLLDGVQVFALEIFDERQFQHRAVIGLAGDDGNFRQIQKLRRAPAAFAGDQFKKTAAFAHDERLDDALFADRIREFLQRLVGKILARLERAGPDAAQRHAPDALAGVGRGNRVRGLNGRSRGGWARTGLPPNNAPRPRPKAGFAMRAECQMKSQASSPMSRDLSAADDLDL